MRKKLRVAVTALVGATRLIAFGVLTDCVTDSREDQSVQVVSNCDLTKLDLSPSSPEATLNAYVNSAEALATAAQDVDTQLTAICTQMDTDLGLSPTGTDAVGACSPIAKRVSAAFSAAPPPPAGPAPPPWFNL